ncbi:hypothetical protein [Brucella intermedia]|uniref:hypothetical protein n=1 Tax=Brucella intermedia TaxID=94625 RepID=UPI00224AA8E8|nr:hypothetical protein [Brucella intermedia]
MAISTMTWRTSTWLAMIVSWLARSNTMTDFPSWTQRNGRKQPAYHAMTIPF